MIRTCLPLGVALAALGLAGLAPAQAQQPYRAYPPNGQLYLYDPGGMAAPATPYPNPIPRTGTQENNAVHGLGYPR
jgi:hypothetical protein